MIESPDDLAAILKREFEAADNYYDQIEAVQEAAFRYYEAQPFGNEVDGRSQIVLPDVQETCDYMGQSVLRTFISGDRTIEFEATNEEDEQAADDATAAIDYRFMREQDGYSILNDVVQDGNLKMIGVFKALAESEERVSRTWEVMPAEALGLLPVPEGVEIEDVREFEEMDETGQPVPMVRVLIKTQSIERKHKIVSVPTREFRFSGNAKHEDSANYLAHVQEKTRSDLVGMGFDPEQVYALPMHNEWDDIESETLDYHLDEESSEALERVLLCEEYARIDVDGDGIAERVKCYRVENEILRWQDGELAIETVDEQPFAVFCPFPRAHRLVGYSLAHKVMDIQLARSEIARQLFDGMAYANMPRMVVDEDLATDNTIDDLLNPIPGSPVRGKVGAVTPLPSNFDVGRSLTVMEWMTGERESRTGITRMNQGLDADTLNKTATGTALMQSAGQQFEEYIARNLAEAFARACAKLYRLMRVEAEPFQIKVDGKYRTVDPSTWPESVNMVVRVGLGTNAKDKRIQGRMAILGPLTQALAEGLAGPEHAYKWMDGIVRDLGVGQGDDYMYDPADPEVQQRLAQKEAEPDPELVKVQEEMAMKREQQAFDMEMAMLEAEERFNLEAYKINGEIDLATYRADVEARLGAFKARMEAQNKANVTEQRMGGSLAS